MSATSSGPGGMSTRHALLLGGGLAAVGGVILAAPALLGFNVVPPCPFRSITGLDCPFCGGTRATRALVTGDMGSALDYNVLVPLMALTAVGVGLWWLLSRTSDTVSIDPMRRAVASKAVWIVVAVGLMLFWVLRNLPAFSYLNSGGFAT